MMATIYMIFDNDPNEYPYGTYAYNTHLEKNRVNEISKALVDKRKCAIRVSLNPNNI